MKKIELHSVYESKSPYKVTFDSFEEMLDFVEKHRDHFISPFQCVGRTLCLSSHDELNLVKLMK